MAVIIIYHNINHGLWIECISNSIWRIYRKIFQPNGVCLFLFFFLGWFLLLFLSVQKASERVIWITKYCTRIKHDTTKRPTHTLCLSLSPFSVCLFSWMHTMTRAILIIINKVKLNRVFYLSAFIPTIQHSFNVDYIFHLLHGSHNNATV